jgi:hypothetical protein
MDSVVGLRTRLPDVGIPVLKTEFEVEVDEHNSVAE